jgi:hypothetical protein
MQRPCFVAFLLVSLAGLLTRPSLAAHPDAGQLASGWSIALAKAVGQRVDLHTGWGPARACLVFPGRLAKCFRDESALNAGAGSLTASDVNCSTPLRLSEGPNQSGMTVSIFTRGLWIDLDSVGFDNRTSSYGVGACAIELAAGPGGSGRHYPRCLFAGCTENVMAPDWDNVVSSVYLH